MPIKTIYQAETERLDILDKDGKADSSLMPDLSRERLVEAYKMMIRIRKMDEKILNLQRQGRMGTYGSIRGQEACQAGIKLAMDEGDWTIPSFREHGIQVLAGIPMHQVMAIWKGDERGHVYPENVRCLPVSVPVGSQLLHGVGVGMALRLKGDKAVAVAYAGDGATSEGDFHEAMNFAGVFKSRCLIFIQNNQWAISVPFKNQTAAGSIAQRAHGYGFPGLQVDGNDVLAVYAGAKKALDHIRSGKGPYLIEALTYRMENHTTADDHTRYRPKEEVEYWLDRDPVKRMKIFLTKKKLWTEKKEKDYLEQVKKEVEDEVKKLEAMPPAPASDIFDFMYETLPQNLKEQREALMSEVRQ
ncbi:MAG: pyruvate dehydrogenase (acetyl-transferring) E1 component subunit alpha [Acidobacteriota bacterium]|jgi:pyruvate dehydrogenase E1 component alpha subunit